MSTPSNRIVSREEWTRERKALLEREKAFTHERDALSAKRRELPMVKVEKKYVFAEPSGTRTLAELFGGKRQLVVYHFMLPPGAEAGCRGCSYVADHFEGAIVHLAARDTAFAAVSLAPVAEIERFKKRMGWKFRWLSSSGTEFNYDYDVSFRPEDVVAKKASDNYQTAAAGASEVPGLSVFLEAGGDVFHTYSTYRRGLDLLLGTYNFLDLTPLGRHEEDLPYGMAWVRHHDKYDAT